MSSSEEEKSTSNDGVVELLDDDDAKEEKEKADESAAAPFLSQGEIVEEALNPDLSDPKQARVIIYIILSLIPVLFLIPLMLGSRDLIPLDALPPVDLWNYNTKLRIVYKLSAWSDLHVAKLENEEQTIYNNNKTAFSQHRTA